MRFIHTADWHIGALRSGLPDDYLARAYDMIEQIIKVTKEQSDGVLVVAGDLFHHKIVTDAERNLLLKALLKMERMGIFTLMINGNHDIVAPGKS